MICIEKTQVHFNAEVWTNVNILISYFSKAVEAQISVVVTIYEMPISSVTTKLSVIGQSGEAGW